MVSLVIGTATSEKIRRDLCLLEQEVRIRRFGSVELRDLSFEDRLSVVCEDSLFLQDFIMEVEDHYSITLGMHETMELETVSDLVEMIESKL
jgi:acyl carrier protein